MKGYFSVLLFTLHILLCVKDSEAQWYLRCRLCSRANSLEDCTTFTECSEQETCYTDLVVTQDQRLVYDAGCRSKKVCGHENKRALTGEMVACSRCCTRGDYCNDGLCGLKKNTNIRMCMSCDGHEGRPAAKPYPEDCQRFRVCDYNEACFARTTSVAGNSAVEHYTSCLDLRTCQSLVNGIKDAYHQGDALLGKRNTNICAICCNDELCNEYSCAAIKRRIVNLIENDAFNMTTLQEI
ncbi:uncharacterized protein LOC128224923 [Mya arenaria]|uniref:uncharacterized protein LOC128224923 n=1 Tax=Mya arenaria TaxID=6604 RepID=UPI0022E93C99|nr:uncharacterized protein LOC128224923 [Mya arenaria]